MKITNPKISLSFYVFYLMVMQYIIVLITSKISLQRNSLGKTGNILEESTCKPQEETSLNRRKGRSSATGQENMKVRIPLEKHRLFVVSASLCPLTLFSQCRMRFFPQQKNLYPMTSPRFYIRVRLEMTSLPKSNNPGEMASLDPPWLGVHPLTMVKGLSAVTKLFLLPS